MQEIGCIYSSVDIGVRWCDETGDSAPLPQKWRNCTIGAGRSPYDDAAFLKSCNLSNPFWNGAKSKFRADYRTRFQSYPRAR